MLKYHKISSQPCETKMQKIEHYLTLGSYQCEHKIDGIKSFSFVTMMPETRMTISNNLSESETNYLIPISNTVRVDETVISPNEIIKNPKHVQEIYKKESDFLYIIVDSNQNVESSEENSQNYVNVNTNDNVLTFGYDLETVLNSKVKILKKIFKQGYNLYITKKTLVWVKNSKFSVNETDQKFEKSECLYTRKGCGKIKFEEDTEIVIVYIKE